MYKYFQFLDDFQSVKAHICFSSAVTNIDDTLIIIREKVKLNYSFLLRFQTVH